MAGGPAMPRARCATRVKRTVVVPGKAIRQDDKIRAIRQLFENKLPKSFPIGDVIAITPAQAMQSALFRPARSAMATAAINIA